MSEYCYLRSQIPTFETRSDGRDNFVGALILAGNYNIPEVTVFFRLNVKPLSQKFDIINRFDLSNVLQTSIDERKPDHKSKCW